MRTLIARYPGRCTRTGAPIRPGDTILVLARGRYALASPAPADAADAADAADSEPVNPDLALAQSIDPETAALDPDAAASAGRYLRQSLARGVSHVWGSPGGREYYRNRKGRCEDAPCCGCCNI